MIRISDATITFHTSKFPGSAQQRRSIPALAASHRLSRDAVAADALGFPVIDTSGLDVEHATDALVPYVIQG